VRDGGEISVAAMHARDSMALLYVDTGGAAGPWSDQFSQRRSSSQHKRALPLPLLQG